MKKVLSILLSLCLGACASLVLSPITSAVHNGDLEALRYEIEVNGASPNSRDYENKPILLRAAWLGHQEIVDYLIKKGANVHLGNVNNQQPLHIATTYGHFTIVRSLVAAGADINAIKKDTQSTPLLLAGLNNRHDIATFLIRQGADIQQTDYKGNDILAYAQKNNDVALTQQIRSIIEQQIAQRKAEKRRQQKLAQQRKRIEQQKALATRSVAAKPQVKSETKKLTKPIVKSAIPSPVPPVKQKVPTPNPQKPNTIKPKEKPKPFKI